jgi:hypothetical protein
MAESEIPKRVQLSRKKGWRMPENTVKVDRSTIWGNDCTIEDYGSAEKAVFMFEHELDKFMCFHPEKYDTYIRPLIGKNLACWCKPGAPCHADVLLREAEIYGKWLAEKAA